MATHIISSSQVVAERILGVPVSSTMWVGVYTCMFAMLFRTFVPPTHGARAQDIAIASASGYAPRSYSVLHFTSLLRACFAALLSIPLMMAHMMLVQCLMGGSLPPPPPPTGIMLGMTMIAYGSLALSSIADAASDVHAQENKLMREQERRLGTAGAWENYLVFCFFFILFCIVLLLLFIFCRTVVPDFPRFPRFLLFLSRPPLSQKATTLIGWLPLCWSTSVH